MIWKSSMVVFSLLRRNAGSRVVANRKFDSVRSQLLSWAHFGLVFSSNVAIFGSPLCHLIPENG